MKDIVWVYTHGDEIRVFSTSEKANEWFAEHDPEGVAFGYELDDDAPLQPQEAQSSEQGSE